MKKESLQTTTVKTLLAVLLFVGIGTIIIGWGYIIGEYSKNKTNNQIVKPVNQEIENYYDVLEKKCADNCCMSSLKTMRANNYKEADKNGKCSEGYSMDMMKCVTSYQWCVPIKEVEWESCDEDNDCEARFSHCDCQYYCVNKNIETIDCAVDCDETGPEIFKCVCENNKCVDKKSDISDWLPSDSSYFSSLVSVDGQKIVWTENKFQENKMNSKLMLADLDGQNRKMLLEKDFNGEKYLNPIRWSNSNKEIYFSEQHGGLGGYIIFSGPTNLSKINIYTGKIEYLFGENNYIGYIGDISPNEKFIACFAKGNNPKLTIKNMETGEEIVIGIPIEDGFRGGGNACFSPDNKHLVYNIAHWDSDDEYYQTIVISSTGEKQKVIIDDPQKMYNPIGWISNDEILLCSRSDAGCIDYIINIDGGELRKK